MLDDTKLEYLTNTLPVLKTLYMYTNCCGGTRNKKLTEYLKKAIDAGYEFIHIDINEQL